MQLKLFHGVLITGAIALGVLLVIFSLYRREQDFVLTGVLGAVLAIGGAFYLRWFNRKQMK
jgi:hypothetical protein